MDATTESPLRGSLGGGSGYPRFDVLRLRLRPSSPGVKHGTAASRLCRISAPDGEKGPRVGAVCAWGERGPWVGAVCAWGEKGPRVGLVCAWGEKGPRVGSVCAWGEKGPRVGLVCAWGVRVFPSLKLRAWTKNK